MKELVKLVDDGGNGAAARVEDKGCMLSDLAVGPRGLVRTGEGLEDGVEGEQ